MRELVLAALRRRLAVAERGGDTERAERLRQRLAAVDIVPANEAGPQLEPDVFDDGLDDLSYSTLRDMVASAEVVPESRKKEDLIAALRAAHTYEEEGS